MAGPFDHIPEEVKRAAAEDAAPKTGGTKTAKRPPVDKPPTGGEKKQKQLFKYRRAKEKGLLRSEGKEYVVKDGDMIYFRFNV